MKLGWDQNLAFSEACAILPCSCPRILCRVSEYSRLLKCLCSPVHLFSAAVSLISEEPTEKPEPADLDECEFTPLHDLPQNDEQLTPTTQENQPHASSPDYGTCQLLGTVTAHSL